MPSFAPLASVATITSGKRPTVVAKEATLTLQVPVIGGGGTSGYTSNALFDGNILVTGRVGTLGKLFAPSGPCWPSDNALVIYANSARTDQRFLRYALQLRIAEALGMNRGAANPLITQTDLGRLEIYHPKLDDQRAIASTLAALDDKIDLNRRMNETLEAMARAIFKDWFVDFGPTRAKMEGRAPYLAPEIWVLFPEQLDDGGVPNGWDIGEVGELAEIASGKRPEARSDSPDAEARVPLWGGNGPMGFVSRPLFDHPILLTGRVGTLGSVFRIKSPCWPSDNTLVLNPRTTEMFDYLYFQLKEIDFNSLNRGSTQPLLTQTDLRSQRLLTPSSHAFQSFNSVVRPLFNRIDSNENESETLAATRDLLLPKLMSSEIRVRDAEKELERVP